MKAAEFFRQFSRLSSTRPLQRTRTSVYQTRQYSNVVSSQTLPFLSLFARNTRRTSVRHQINKRFAASKPPFNPTPNLNSPNSSLSITQRFKKLSREYGWSALGVYLALSALDFPFCFLAVRWLGTERVGHWEHIILEWFWSVVPNPLPSAEGATKAELETVGKKLEEYGVVGSKDGEIGVPGYDHGVAEAEKRNQSEDASIWTQLALAYAIHKSFMFVRVPLTAAVTPKVVKTLRRWGWDIGKRRPKGPKEIKKD